MSKLNIRPSYKIGMDEVQGLEGVIRSLLKPVIKSLQDKIYWSGDIQPEPAEYLSRDGFIASKSNCGGLQFKAVIPRCEQGSFDFMDWNNCDFNNEGESHECDDYCDGYLNIWFKFEGIEGGIMKFYLVMSGGDQDAPYFRNVTTLFEAEFTAKTFTELKRKGKTQINKLLKIVR